MIHAELHRLVTDLVEGRSSELLADGRTGRLTVEELQTAIAGYPGGLTHPPRSAYEHLNLIGLQGTEVQYALDFDLWVDGRQSDLTLSCTVALLPTGDIQIEIDDLHVL